VQDDGALSLGLRRNTVNADSGRDRLSVSVRRDRHCAYSQYTGRNPRILTCKDFKVLICCLYSISNSTYMHMRSARRHSETLSKNFQGPQYGLSSLGPLCPLFVFLRLFTGVSFAVIAPFSSNMHSSHTFAMEKAGKSCRQCGKHRSKCLVSSCSGYDSTAARKLPQRQNRGKDTVMHLSSDRRS
jgi:hypothetical protein